MINIAPKTGQPNITGGQVAVAGPTTLPAFALGDFLMFLIAGAIPGVVVSVSLTGEKQRFLGVVNAAGFLMAQVEAIGAGSIDGVIIGKGFFMADGSPQNNFAGFMAAAYGPAAPPPPPLPAGIEKTAQETYARRNAGNPIITNADYPTYFWYYQNPNTGRVEKYGTVAGTPGQNLSMQKTTELATLLGATIGSAIPDRLTGPGQLAPGYEAPYLPTLSIAGGSKTVFAGDVAYYIQNSADVAPRLREEFGVSA